MSRSKKERKKREIEKREQYPEEERTPNSRKAQKWVGASIKEEELTRMVPAFCIGSSKLCPFPGEKARERERERESQLKKEKREEVEDLHDGVWISCSEERERERERGEVYLGEFSKEARDGVWAVPLTKKPI